MSRLPERFAELAGKERPGLVTFVTAGDPDMDRSKAILRQLPEAGADIIELGMPFSDPMADGPAIQAASQRALMNGMTLTKTLQMVTDFRQADTDTPIVLMGYYNPIYIYGLDKFIADAAAAGVDGLIVVDLPLEETELRDVLPGSGIDFVYLTAPTTDDDRLSRLAERASGFIYYVSVTGITGTKSAETGDVAAAIERLRRHTDLPIAVGFGIKTPEQAAAIGQHADAAVVGSALVTQVAENLDFEGKGTDDCVDAVLDLVRDLASGVRSVSKVVGNTTPE